MSSVVGASLSALLFPFIAQRGRRTHTQACCFARLLFKLMVRITNHIHVWCSCLAALCLVSWIKERSIYWCIVSVLVSHIACLFRRPVSWFQRASLELGPGELRALRTSDVTQEKTEHRETCFKWTQAELNSKLTNGNTF